MRIWEVVKPVIQGQLLAVIPRDQEDAFKAHLYTVNMQRFITQSLVLIVMDVLSLLFYALYYITSKSLLPWHLAVHGAKIIINALTAFFLTNRYLNGHGRTSFFDRNIEVIYPFCHLLLEFALFASGPHDLGALLRFAAVPFIVGGIPVIKQSRALVLEAIAYLTGIVYLHRLTVYAGIANPYGLFVNAWGVVFPCAILVSFTVYSWFVNTFIAKQRANEVTVEMRRLNKRLSVISMHDPLTDLLNRRGFQQEFDIQWHAHKDPSDTATVMMIDIDYFKLFNDKYGHLSGDDCLVEVTKALSETLDSDAYKLARYGGEEFIVAAFNKPHDEMVLLSNRLRMKILGMRIDNPDSDVAPYVTISIGVATMPIAETRHQDALINEADECLYFAKRFGRNQIVQKENDEIGFRDLHGARLDMEEDGTFESTSMRRAFRDISVDCTFVYDAKSTMLTFSPAASEIFNLPPHIQQPSIERIAEHLPIVPEDKRIFRKALRQCVADRSPFFVLDVHLYMPSHEQRLISLRANFLYGEDGGLDIAHGTMLSIEKILEYSNYINKHALTSVITLLPNRQKLYLDLKARLSTKDASGYLVFLDIVDFKEINGVYGHVLGDKALCEVAVRLSKLSDGHEPVYHYGVDQFVVDMYQTSKEDVEDLIESIEADFRTQTVEVEGTSLSIRFKIVAVEYKAATELETLLIDLDIAIQLVKFDPKHTSMFFTAADRESFLQKFNLNKALVHAVENDMEGFMMMYQPIIDMKKQNYIGAEALLRWKDEDGTIISPMTVVPVLEQSGLMGRVETWIFDTACQDCRRWIDGGASETFFVNINLSPQFICRESLRDEIAGSIEKYHLSMKNITFEVPETAQILEMKSTIETLKMLRDIGIRIAIDDFGTGYSSLNYLGTLPADEVKIDRSFVLDIDENPNAHSFLDAVISLAKSMDFLVCVEGIETSSQSDKLGMTGADFLQGFYFGKPMPPDAFYEQFIEPKEKKDS